MLAAPMRTLLPLLFVPALLAQAQPADTYPELVAAHAKAAAAATSPEAAARELLPRFLAAAARQQGKAEAVPLLLWVARHGGLEADVAKAALTLVDDHVKDPAIGELAEHLPFLATYDAAPAASLLARIVDGNSHPEVQARALFARASLTFTRPDAAAEQLLAARDDLAKVAKLTKDKALAARAEGMAAADRGLAIGSAAPEIAGFDLDGTPFRLSDYRGKVVVLDFWGDW
jgi:hypothetical protein